MISGIKEDWGRRRRVGLLLIPINVRRKSRVTFDGESVTQVKGLLRRTPDDALSILDWSLNQFVVSCIGIYTLNYGGVQSFGRL